MATGAAQLDKTETDLWQIRLLNGLDAKRRGAPLGKLRSKTSAALLAYLSYYAGREFSRFELEEMFWPDSDPDRQAQNLRKSVSDLHQALEAESERGTVLETRREYVKLSKDHVVTDVARFEELVELAQGKAGEEYIALISEAVETYAGPLLPSHYESWITSERLRLEEEFAASHVDLSKNLVQAGRARDAVRIGRRAVTLAPLREDVHVSLMKAYAAAGLNAEAMRQFEELERILDEQWGETPSAEAQRALNNLPRDVVEDTGEAITLQPARQTLRTKVVIVACRGAKPDEDAADSLETALKGLGAEVSVDREAKVDADWAKSVEEQIRVADRVVVLLSDTAAESETVLTELEIAHDQDQARPDFQLAIVRIGRRRTFDGVLGGIVNSRVMATWYSTGNSSQIATRVLEFDKSSFQEDLELEELGGAVPLDSHYYVRRETDDQLDQSLARRDGMVLIKGPRQIGKTSLLARGLKEARNHGFKVALTDFQAIESTVIGSQDRLYGSLAYALARELEVEIDVRAIWNEWLGPNSNFEQIVEAMILKFGGPVLWAMDEADRLFPTPYASDFFGLLRSWYNRRALEPGGPWSQLSIVITYATEAHLFISDINQSPFNIGTRLELEDFTVGQVQELNEKYDSPLQEGEIKRLYELTGGQPFLTRLAFDSLVSGEFTLTKLECYASDDDSPFTDHLRRVLMMVARDPEVADAVKDLLIEEPVNDERLLYRLRAGGLLSPVSGDFPSFRIPAYREFLAAHLG